MLRTVVAVSVRNSAMGHLQFTLLFDSAMLQEDPLYRVSVSVKNGFVKRANAIRLSCFFAETGDAQPLWRPIHVSFARLDLLIAAWQTIAATEGESGFLEVIFPVDPTKLEKQVRYLFEWCVIRPLLAQVAESDRGHYRVSSKFVPVTHRPEQCTLRVSVAGGPLGAPGSLFLGEATLQGSGDDRGA